MLINLLLIKKKCVGGLKNVPAVVVVATVDVPNPKAGKDGATLAVVAVPNNEGAEVPPGAAAEAGVPNVKLMALYFLTVFFSGK